MFQVEPSFQEGVGQHQEPWEERYKGSVMRRDLGGGSCMKLWVGCEPRVVYKGDTGLAWRSVQVGVVGVST